MFGLKRVKKQINVSGMHCGHCAANVEKAIMAIEGVKSVSADAKSGVVKIVSTVELNDAAIAEAVKGAGFEVA